MFLDALADRNIRLMSVLIKEGRVSRSMLLEFSEELLRLAITNHDEKFLKLVLDRIYLVLSHNILMAVIKSNDVYLMSMLFYHPNVVVPKIPLEYFRYIIRNLEAVKVVMDFVGADKHEAIKALFQEAVRGGSSSVLEWIHDRPEYNWMVDWRSALPRLFILRDIELIKNVLNYANLNDVEEIRTLYYSTSDEEVLRELFSNRSVRNHMNRSFRTEVIEWAYLTDNLSVVKLLILDPEGLKTLITTNNPNLVSLREELKDCLRNRFGSSWVDIVGESAHPQFQELRRYINSQCGIFRD